ncbi:outer membrane lipoprotein carrier protein LolA [Prescottella equi]|uniref:LolA family protein n=1 Tax=Rhodococcus hoagii TaxID=43767 RepID=UPI00384CF66F
MTDWSEVLAALSDGPDLPLRGTIRELGAPAKPDRVLFAGEGPPIVVRPGNGCRIWRDGGRLRIEHPDGRPIFITDGARAWQFTADDGQRPRTDALDRVRFLGLNQHLVRRRTPAEWAGEDLTHPFGAVADTEVAGRRCWTVELAPPADEAGLLRVWVDTEAGYVLRFRAEPSGQESQYVDLAVGEQLDDELFTWDGPVFTPEEYEQILRERRHVREQEQLEWFTETIAPSPITARAQVDFSPTWVPFLNPETGAFDASGHPTMLARRPRRTESWLPPWGTVHYVWSTPQWDWAAAVFDAELDDEAISQLQQQLHAGDTVDRQRRIDPDE